MPDDSSLRCWEMMARCTAHRCFNRDDRGSFAPGIRTPSMLHRKNGELYPSYSIFSDICLFRFPDLPDGISGKKEIMPYLQMNGEKIPPASMPPP